MNVTLAKNVLISLAELLRPVVTTDLSMQFFVEGVDREQSEYFQKDSVVLRVSGPTPKYGIGQTRYKFEAMVMITDHVDDAENGYLNIDRASTIGNVLSGPVPVFEYPAGTTQVGCLDFDQDATEPLRIVQFGKLDKDTEIVQAAVTVSYEICLDA